MTSRVSALAVPNLLNIAFVAVLGAGILFIAGFAHSQTLHDAAHDTRHASGFPCH